MGHHSSPGHILVVDDEDEIRRALVRFFIKHGIETMSTLRHIDPNVSVIMVTAFKNEEKAKTALALPSGYSAIKNDKTLVFFGTPFGKLFKFRCNLSYLCIVGY